MLDEPPNLSLGEDPKLNETDESAHLTDGESSLGHGALWTAPRTHPDNVWKNSDSAGADKPAETLTLMSVSSESSFATLAA